MIVLILLGIIELVRKNILVDLIDIPMISWRRNNKKGGACHEEILQKSD